MNYEFKLALKYFRAQRKSLARFTAIIAVIGIAAGIASLIVAQSLARNFQAEMQDKILANTSHISIYQVNGEEITNWRMLKNDLSKIENVSEVSPTSYISALLVNSDVTAYAVLRLKENKSQETKAQSEIAVSIGRELAEKTKLKIGDEAEIILPTSQNEFAPKTSRVVINDIFTTGLYDYDSTWVYVSMESFAALTQRPNFSPSVLSVSVKDIYRAGETAEKLREILPKDYKILDWQEANRPLFAALSLEKKVSLAIILLVIFIATLNITTTLALLTNERKLDIAILRTCGAQTKNIVTIFLLEGLLLGAGGVLAGLIIGLLICYLGTHFKIIRLPTEVYWLNFIPLTPNLFDVVIIVFVAFLLILSATVYPAWKASGIKPLENLRNV